MPIEVFFSSFRFYSRQLSKRSLSHRLPWEYLVPFISHLRNIYSTLQLQAVIWMLPRLAIGAPDDPLEKYSWDDHEIAELRCGLFAWKFIAFIIFIIFTVWLLRFWRFVNSGQIMSMFCTYNFQGGLKNLRCSSDMNCRRRKSFNL